MIRENFYKNIPETPGIYKMKDKNDEIIYIGKAGNLKKRVSSYFLKNKDPKTEKLVSQIKSIECIKTETVIEALILEANLIKELKPKYNIKDKDDRSFLYVLITREEYKRVLLIRKNEKGKISGKLFGPFTSASSIRNALRIIRKIFPFNIHNPEKIGKYKRPCFDYQINLCPGTCIKKIDKKEYLKNIKNIELFFNGKKKKIIINLRKEMLNESKKLNFEKAEKIKRQIFSLQHIQDTSLIDNSNILNNRENNSIRIEGYDISNISGSFAVGSMVVFSGEKPNKKEYKKFKIRTFPSERTLIPSEFKTINRINDTGMINEIIERRFKNDWPLPFLVLIDGGKGQVNIVKKKINEMGFDIPVIGIAKGKERKKNDFIGNIPKGIKKETLIKVRDEAHRFAVSYHRKLRDKVRTFTS